MFKANCRFLNYTSVPMSIIVSASGGGKDFAIHPQSVVAARCTRIIDLGTQQGEWKGKAKSSRKIMFVFESETVMEDDDSEYAGKPFLLMQTLTASLGEKAGMRKLLESWRGTKFTPQQLGAFDLKNVLNKACMINVVHTDPSKNVNGKVYANIQTISPLPAQMKAPPAVGELIFFSLTDFDRAVFEKLSDYVKETIAKSPEYVAATSGKQVQTKSDAPDDDDIPF